MSDVAGVQSVKLYCGKCEDIYNPKSTRHANIDGAYFGTTFQNLLYSAYPALVPEKSIARYIPRVFGFKLHAAATLARWQDGQRNDMVNRLREQGINHIFIEDEGNQADDDMEEDDDNEEGENIGGDGLGD